MKRVTYNKIRKWADFLPAFGLIMDWLQRRRWRVIFCHCGHPRNHPGTHALDMGRLIKVLNQNQKSGNVTVLPRTVTVPPKVEEALDPLSPEERVEVMTALDKMKREIDEGSI